MFEETCRIKSTWKGTKYEHIPISINMSRLHLYNQAYPDQLVEIAGRYQIPTNELELEVTRKYLFERQHRIDPYDQPAAGPRLYDLY